MQLEVTFAVRSNATPSTFPLSILSHMAVLAVPGCAANASMRLLCSQHGTTLSLHTSVTSHCILSQRQQCATDSRADAGYCNCAVCPRSTCQYGQWTVFGKVTVGLLSSTYSLCCTDVITQTMKLYIRHVATC